MLQITRIHDSARRRIVAGHIIRIRVRLVAGDTSHDRHMVEALRNLLKTVRHQNHGAVRLLRTNTTQRTQSNLTPTQIKTRGRLVKNQQIGIRHQRTADKHASAFAFGKLEHHLAFQVFDAEFTHQ